MTWPSGPLTFLRAVVAESSDMRFSSSMTDHDGVGCDFGQPPLERIHRHRISSAERHALQPARPDRPHSPESCNAGRVCCSDLFGPCYENHRLFESPAK